MYHPLQSLREGSWFKLICGASFQHLPAVRSLTLAYALAGADCVDVAADPAVIRVVREALMAAEKIAENEKIAEKSITETSIPEIQIPEIQIPEIIPESIAAASISARFRTVPSTPGSSSPIASSPAETNLAPFPNSDQLGSSLSPLPSEIPSEDRLGFADPHRSARRPWLMVSLNDGEDPHFRKAQFDPSRCPTDCPRPCERICPSQAIVFDQPSEAPDQGQFSGVIDSRCYGCGRCLPICPLGQITAQSYLASPAVVAPLVLADRTSPIDAIEIHTQVGHLDAFQQLWEAIAPFVDSLKLVAISCPDHPDLIEYLWALVSVMSVGAAPRPWALVWQTDGRPMSGDIGDGATRAAVKLGQKVLAAQLPGYVQLAGGTNRHTVEKLRALGLTRDAVPPNSIDRYIAGVAYGSYARTLLAPVLEQLEQTASPPHSREMNLEDSPEHLWQAVHLARSLVSQLKSTRIYSPLTQSLFDSIPM